MTICGGMSLDLLIEREGCGGEIDEFMLPANQLPNQLNTGLRLIGEGRGLTPGICCQVLALLPHPLLPIDR